VQDGQSKTEDRCECGQSTNKRWIISVIWKCWQGYGNLFWGKTRTLAWQVASPSWQFRAHDALRVREFLAKKSITKMDHPFYLPELAPCDFWLFPKLKKCLKGQRFADIPDTQRNVTTL
jgi:hypothetical protein